MRKIFLFILGLVSCFGVYAIDVEVEQVLDAPPSQFGTFYGDSAIYASNGELLFAGSLAFNLFVRKNDKWIPLIDKYRIDEFNHLQEENRFRGEINLYNSTVPGEFVYRAIQGINTAEYYRVYVDEREELRAEWVDKEYYKSHLKIDPKLGYSRGYDSSLPYGYKIKRIETTKTPDANTFSPVIVDRDDQIVFHFLDGFRKGFVEDTRTITRNFEGTRVAMVITFRPEKDSPYYVASRPQLKKLVIFKIDYEDDTEHP